MTRRRPPIAVLLFAAIVPLLAMIPTWQGYHFQRPPEKVFLGFRYMAGDHYQYAALMRQAQFEGRFFMENRYTTEPQKRVYVFLYYWVLGTMARVSGASLIMMWEVFRWIGGALYILGFWRLAAHYVEGEKRRLLATGLFCFAGGVDWIVTALRFAGVNALKPLEYPFDYYWNWSTFGTMLVPNWVWPASVWIVACLLLLSRSRLRDAGLFALPPIIWGMHHHTALVVYLCLGLMPLTPLLVNAARIQPLDWKRARANLRLVLPGLCSFALVAAYLLWARQDQVFRLNAAMSMEWKVFFSVWWYPLSYGLLLPLAWFGLKELASEEGLPRDLAFAWLLAAVVLSLNPIAGGAKYQYLIFPPLILVAVRGYGHLLRNSPAVGRLLKWPPIAAACGLLLFMNAPVSLVKDMPAVKADPEICATQGEVEAMTWLASQPEGVVLSSYRMGHLIPWLSGKTVYAGHWFMTLNLREKMADVAYLYSDQVPLDYKKRILRKSGARYVFDGPSEAAMGKLESGLPLKAAYDKNGVAVYEVTSEY